MVQPFERALNQIAQNTSVMAEQMPIITDSVKKIYQVESEERNKEEKKSVEKERAEADTAGGKGETVEILKELGGLASSMASIRALLKNNLSKGEGGIAEFVGDLVRRLLPGVKGKQEGGFVYKSPIEGFMKGGGVYTVPGNSTGDNHPMLLPAGSFVLNRNASKYLDSVAGEQSVASLPFGFESGGMVPTVVESKEKIFAPGKWDGLIPILNSVIPRFASGGIVEHLHGDPSRTGYDFSHGTQSNAHDHFAFTDPETKDYVKAELQKLGYIIGSENSGVHANNSYHYSNQAFDIPWSQFGSGAIKESDYIKSRKLLQDVKNILANRSTDGSTQPVPGLTGIDFLSTPNQNNNSEPQMNPMNSLASFFGFPTIDMASLFPEFMSPHDIFSQKQTPNPTSSTTENTGITSSESISSQGESELLKKLIVAEAGGEDLLGQALVAKSIMNRLSLVQSGKVSPGKFNALDPSLTGIINGKGQYQPMSDGRINSNFSDGQLEKATKAIEMATNVADLRGRLEASGVSAKNINNLVNATGFRTVGAGYDKSQDVNVVQYGNHLFNTAGNDGMGFQKGGLVKPAMVESGEKIFSPGSFGPEVQMLNEAIPRFQSGGTVNISRSMNPIHHLFQQANKAKMNSDQSSRQPIVIPVPQPVPMGGGGTVNDNTSGSYTPQLPNEPSNHIVSTLIMQTYALMNRIG